MMTFRADAKTTQRAFRVVLPWTWANYGANDTNAAILQEMAGNVKLAKRNLLFPKSRKLGGLLLRRIWYNESSYFAS